MSNTYPNRIKWLHWAYLSRIFCSLLSDMNNERFEISVWFIVLKFSALDRAIRICYW